MDVIRDFTLVTLVGSASFFDLKERRIPNWIVIGGLAVALLVGPTIGNQITATVAGFFVGILILLVPFALGWLGAGDVKLFGAIGALLGHKMLPRILFYSCIIAGFMALLALAAGHAKGLSFRRLWLDCKLMVVTRGIGPRAERDTYSVPWGVAIGAGTIMAYYVDRVGAWAGF